MRKSISAILAFIVLLSSVSGNVSAVNSTTPSLADNTNGKILYIVPSQEDLYNIVNCSAVESTGNIVDLTTIDELEIDNLWDYNAIAISYNLSGMINLEQLFQSGKRIFLYGKLTISEYARAVNAPLESQRIINDINESGVGSVDRITVKLEDVGNEYAVIGWTNKDVANKGVLCTFDEADIEPYYYYKAVIDSYVKSQSPSLYSIELIDQQTDYVTYYNGAQSATYMDWYLSKDMGELDSDRDYYAVTTHVWATTDAPGSDLSSVGVRNSVAKSGDELYDCAPADSSSLDGVGISVDLISGSVSASLNLSSDPDVVRNEDFTNDTVEWQFYPRALFPLPIEGEVFKTITVWSTDTTNSASMDIEYRSATQRGNTFPIYQSWSTVRVSVK